MTTTNAICLTLAVLLLAAQGARAEDKEVPRPPPRVFDAGRLLATSGVANVEGAAGGGLATWAVIGGYGSRDAVGVNVHVTGVRLTDFNLAATGASIGVHDRVELSYQHQWFDTSGAGRRLGLGGGYSIQQDIVGAKVRLFGDVVADQDTWLPQVSVGVQGKFSRNAELVKALGARSASGADFYVAATKLFLGQGLLLNATVRLTRANQLGLLGFGGDRGNAYHPEFEGTAALLLSRTTAIGAEYRTKPDNLGFAKEGKAFSAFGVWFLNHNLSLTAAYVDLGPIARQGRQSGAYLSLETGF